MNIFNPENITISVIFFYGGVSFLISMGELLVRKRRIENLIFFALLFSFGILVFQMGFILNKTALLYPQLLYFHLTLLYLIGPFAYFAYFLIILPRDTLPAKMMLYLLPSVIALAFDIYYIRMSPDAQKIFLEGLLFSGDISQHIYIRILFAITALQYLFYLSFLLARFFMIWIKIGHKTVLLVAMVFLLYTIIGSELTLSGYIIPSQATLRWGCFMMAAPLISAFLVSQRFPKFLQLIIDETEKKYHSKSLLNGIDVDNLISRLKECMCDKKMYINDELTLRDLAGELSVTSHQLSQLLNERLSTNFNNFVNQYRINEAKLLLVNEPDRSVISIAYAVGFNTKSSFYYAFSRFTGKNPQEFRKENM